jgi:hypothetical protein
MKMSSYCAGAVVRALLEFAAQCCYHIRSSDVVLVRLAETHGLVGPRFPTRIVGTKRNIFPENLEFVVVLTSESCGGAAGFCRQMLHDVLDFILEVVFGCIRDCILDLRH